MQNSVTGWYGKPMIDLNDSADRKELARTIAGGIALALTLVASTITLLSL